MYNSVLKRPWTSNRSLGGVKLALKIIYIDVVRHEK